MVPMIAEVVVVVVRKTLTVVEVVVLLKSMWVTILKVREVVLELKWRQ